MTGLYSASFALSSYDNLIKQTLSEKNKIEFDYTFGDHVTVKFDIYHVLENSDWGLLRSNAMDNGPSSHELIGVLEVPLGTLLTCKDGKYSTSLRLNGMSDDWIKSAKHDLPGVRHI